MVSRPPMTQKKSSTAEEIIFSTAYVNKVLRAKQAKQLYMQGASISEIAQQMNLCWTTAKKYVEGTPEEVCSYHRTVEREAEFGLSNYRDFVIGEIAARKKLTVIYRQMREHGYAGSYESFKYHCKKLKADAGITNQRDKSSQMKTKPPDMITRAGIFKHLWEGLEITPEHLDYIFTHYTAVGILDRCIKDFRYVFKHQSIPLLYCFIENYSNCGIKPVESFAKGLLNDIEAVENAVSMNLSNGFVEGTNSKTKMIKRTMYGRCNLPLLRAKIILAGYK